jgi:two-component system sensor histidine kinase TctE
VLTSGRLAAQAVGNLSRRRAARPALVLLAVLAAPQPVVAAEDPFIYPARGIEVGRLVLHCATDRVAMEPLILDFQEANPGLAITYRDFGTNELYASVTQTSAGAVPDVVVSSAMDLQAKLVNDGWTRPHVSQHTRQLPAWANWRDEAFGFTYEPAVIVYRRGRLGADQAPRSRADLIRLLREQHGRFRGRVATYDPARSGVGYLFATQDSVLSSQFWPLAAALGDAQARLYDTSAEMLDAVERGEIDIAYNVLASYAQAHAAAGAPIEIVTPLDYVLVMSRVVAIPERASNPGLAGTFVDYLLSGRGQRVLAVVSKMRPIASGKPEDVATGPASGGDGGGSDRPIALGPALLVFLDGIKRQRFLAGWRLAFEIP